MMIDKRIRDAIGVALCLLAICAFAGGPGLLAGHQHGDLAGHGHADESQNSHCSICVVASIYAHETAAVDVTLPAPTVDACFANDSAEILHSTLLSSSITLRGPPVA